MSSSLSPPPPRRGLYWVTCGLMLVGFAVAVAVVGRRPGSPAPSSDPPAAQAPVGVPAPAPVLSPEELAYRQALAEVHTALAAGQRDRAAERLDGCDLARRRWEWYVLRRLCAEAPAALTLASTDAATQGVLSRDGRRAAFLYNPSNNGASLHVFDTADGRQLMEVPQRPGAGADMIFDFLTLSPDGRRLAMGVADRTRTGREVVQGVFEVRPAPGWGGPYGPFVPTGPFGGMGRRLDPMSPLGGLGSRGGVIVAPVVREVHQTMVGGSLSLDVLTREMLETHQGGVTAAAYGPDGQLWARGGGNAVTLVEGKQESQLDGLPAGQLLRLAFSPDGRRLAAGFSDASVVVWDVKTRKPLAPPLRVEVGGIGIQVGVKDGAIVVVAVLGGKAADKEGTIKAGDRILAVSGPDGKMVSMEAGHLLEFTQLGRGRVGTQVVVKIRQGDQEKTATLARTPFENLGVIGLAFSPDGRRLAADVSSSAAVWDLESKQDLERKSREAIIHGVGWAMAFTPDGRLLVDREGTLIGVNAAGDEMCAVPGLGHVIVDMTCLHDGRLSVLARAGRDLKYYQLSAAALDNQPARGAAPEGDRRQAIRDLTALIESGKEKDAQALARLHYRRGLLLAEEGDFASAKRDLDAAFKLDPSLEKP
jgi:WD40 repeat protein